MSEDFPHFSRSRAKSLNPDWDNVIGVEAILPGRNRVLTWMRGESEDACYMHPGYARFYQPPHEFVTNSVYNGDWDVINMAGFGNYTMPHVQTTAGDNKSNKTDVECGTPTNTIASDVTSNISEEDVIQRKPRCRAVSLSLDWDHVVSSLEKSQKIRKRSRGDELEEEDSSSFRHPGWIQIERTTHSFITGSSYTGQWNGVGMAGSGNYVFTHDVEYEGNLRDGMFHGEGTLTYPMGQKLEGQWVKGKMVSFKFRFADDLEYDDPWKYCQMPDRRFFTSILDGLRPAGRSLLTNIDPTRKIPEGCYDTGDGFYNPETKCVWSAIKPNKILRVPTAAEEKWIMENCRKAWDEPTGYKPELFEHWVSGRQADSVFHPSEDGSQDKTESNSEGSLNIDMLVAPTYNVSPKSSKSWWETVNSDLPSEVS